MRPLALNGRRLQGLYQEALTALRSGGEKRAQAHAGAELGDVLASCGRLKEATGAWNDALDLLAGPYQVWQIVRIHR